jgi:hypothetical protein
LGGPLRALKSAAVATQPVMPNKPSALAWEGSRHADLVSGVEEVDDFHFVVERPGKSELRIYLTNKYILSVTDVIEILSDSPDTNCVVSAMNYNQDSPQAKEYCREQGVGLFKAVELLGAIYRDDDGFLDYVPPKRR